MCEVEFLGGFIKNQNVLRPILRVVFIFHVNYQIVDLER